VKQLHFPDQPLHWDYLLDKLAKPSYYSFSGAPSGALIQLKCSHFSPKPQNIHPL
jgi:hypothetical protein